MFLKDAFNFDFATDDRSLVLSYGPCQVLTPNLRIDVTLVSGSF